MSRHNRRAAIIAIVAALLIANPMYVGLLVAEENSRQPTGYRAISVAPENESDQQTIIKHLGREEIVEVDSLERSDEYGNIEEYRAPVKAVQALQNARSEGPTRVTNPDAQRTLLRLAARHQYVHFPEFGGYHRLDAFRNGSAVTVSVKRVDDSLVARHIVDKDTRLYRSYYESRRDVIDKIIADDELGYRPLQHEEVDPFTDDLVYKDGTHYVIAPGIHSDDFGPSAHQLVSGGLTLLGFLGLFAATGLLALSARRE